jgi:uncharacterized protein (TIGR00369 family)
MGVWDKFSVGVRAKASFCGDPRRNHTENDLKAIKANMAKKTHGRGHDTRYVRLQKNYCFACGKNNPEGMRMKFTYDEDRDCFVSRFRLGKRYTGPPGHTHGGIIATILDEAMGKVNKLHQVVALTKQITVDYFRPVPLNQPLRVESREVRSKGREHINMAEILNQKDEVLARSEGLFIAIDPRKMFGKFVER